MKQFQSSVRVKIKEYIHTWSEFFFRFNSLHFQFLSPNEPFLLFLITSLHGLQDGEKHCAQLRDIELKTGRKIRYLRFPYVLFSILLDYIA